MLMNPLLVQIFEVERHTHTFDPDLEAGRLTHLYSVAHLLVSAYIRPWRKQASALCLLSHALPKSIPPLAAAPTSLGFQCRQKTHWDIQPRGLSIFWVLGFFSFMAIVALGTPQPLSHSKKSPLYMYTQKETCILSVLLL